MKKYQSYKPSGVEWIKEIPIDWEISKVKKHFIERNVKVNDIDFPPLSVTKNGVIPQLENVSKSDNHDDRKMVCQNDFVINSRSDRKGSSGLSSLTGSVSLINIVLEPHQISPTYSEYLLKSKDFVEEFFRNGKGIHWDLWSTRFSELKNINIPVPPINEQLEIVNFLDENTELINKLVSSKEKKISLLKEQRTSLINHVVTKGLNPKVKMKDSGVEWIGYVPMNWNVLKMKYGVKYINEKGLTTQEDVKISPENVESMTGICFNYHSEYEGEGMKFNKGDILLNKLRLYLKKIVFTEVEGYSMGEMIVLRCSEKLYNRYFYYLLFHQGLIDLLNSQSNGVKLPRVSPELIMNSLIPFPSLTEQYEIVENLDSLTKEIDNLVLLEQKKIDILKEYRQSLISEVVTGKIKVTQ